MAKKILPSLLLCLIIALQLFSANVPLYITFLWHMHQPIYTPGDAGGDDAYSTILRNGTSDGKIFSYSLWDMWASKGGPYRGWSVDAIEQGLDLPHLGAQIDLSGSLVESLNNLAYNNWNGGFYNNWKSRFQTGMNYKTSLNNPRLDVIAFPYHHPMLGLLWENDMVVQFLCNIKLLKNNFPGYNSKGVFPPETSISERAIKALKQVGMEWVMVDNIHLFRTLSDYPWTSASGVVEPNKADQINGTAADKGSSWVQLNGLWAPDKVCMPWGFRPHYAQYIDPETGTNYKIIIIPADCYAGNEDARGGFGALNYSEVFGQYLPYNTDPTHPMISLLHHDGENYGAGSESYYHSNFANYCQWLRDNPTSYVGTTIQDYLDTFPPDPNDVVHFESGGWIGSGCLSPEFQYWLGDPDPYPTGYSPDWNSWAVMTAARNWMMTAYAKINGFGADYFNLTIDSPIISDIIYNTGSDLAKAFHYYIRAQASCYEYWEGGPDEDIWNANPTVADNRAIDIIKNNIGVTTNDNYGIGPSIFLPQRQPYNPGGTEWGVQQPSDFEVWSFIYDLNGIKSAVVKYRVDDDGIIDSQNYTYTGSSGTIYSNNMLSADLPPTQRPSTPTPYYRAKRYYATISGLNNVYVDYWIEATDNKGNTSKSPIMHVWVGQGGGGGGGSQTRWSPENPTQNDIITVYADNSGWLHWGVNGWTLPNTNYWPVGTTEWGDGKAVESPLHGTTSYTINIGPFNDPQQLVTEVNFVFHYSDGTWDNNNGSDYLIPITIVTGNSPPTAPQGFNTKIGCSLVYLSWNLNQESDISYYNIYRKVSGGSYSNIKKVYHPTNTYYDYSVINGTTYYYYITAVDTAINESVPSTEVSATPQQVPQPPTGVSVFEINKTAKIIWNLNPEIDILKYNIYRSIVSGSNYTLIKSVGEGTNTFIDTTVSNYTTYYYTLTAVNTNNFESEYSTEKGVYIPGGAPAAPRNIIATSETDKVYLRWDENTEPDFWYYEIFRTNISGVTSFVSPIATLTNRTNNEYIDYSVTNGGIYYYTLRAVNSNLQESTNSEEVMIKVDEKPAPPHNLQTSSGDGYVLLTWSPNIETNIKGYYVYRSLVSSNFTKLSSLITNGTTSYNDTSVTNGITYYYIVTALNNLLLESEYSSIVSATPHSNVIIPPQPVENFVVENVPEGSALKLSWTTPTSNYKGTLIIRNKEGYSGYPPIPYGMPANGTIYSVGQTFGDNGIVVYANSENIFTNRNLINGNTYYYIAYTYNNDYIYSQPRQAYKKCTDTLSPSSPQNVITLSGYKFIDIFWNKVSDPYDEIKYIVYRKDVTTYPEGSYENISGYVSTTNYRDDTVEYDKVYKYYIVALDSSYNSSAPSEESTESVKLPSGLTSKSGFNYIELSWVNSSEDYLAGYNIYRRKKGDTPFLKLNSSLITTTSYKDNSLQAGVEYEYILKSVDIFSNESSPSPVVSSIAIKPLTENFEIRNNVIYPFSDENNKALIYYKVKKESKVKILVFDINGKMIKSLEEAYKKPRDDNSPYVVEWDGKDSAGELVGSGVYFCVIDIDGDKKVKRIVVIK